MRTALTRATEEMNKAFDKKPFRANEKNRMIYISLAGLRGNLYVPPYTSKAQILFSLRKLIKHNDDIERANPEQKQRTIFN